MAYLVPELLEISIPDITPLHLNREWNRLLERGGHSRKIKAARLLSKKTVRNIAGAIRRLYDFVGYGKILQDLRFKDPACS